MKKQVLVFGLLVCSLICKSAHLDPMFDQEVTLKKYAIGGFTVWTIIELVNLGLVANNKKIMTDKEFSLLPASYQAGLLERYPVACWQEDGPNIPVNKTRSDVWLELRKIQERIDILERKSRHIHARSQACKMLQEDLVEELNWTEEQMNITKQMLQSRDHNNQTTCIIKYPYINSFIRQAYRDCRNQHQDRKAKKLRKEAIIKQPY